MGLSPTIRFNDSSGVAPGTLLQLLRSRRRDIVSRWEQQARAKLASDGVARSELIDALPLFLDEVERHLELSGWPRRGLSVPTGPIPIASEQGGRRLRLGFSVAEVVREYGIISDVVLDLAEESGYVPTVSETRVLARAIARATASAVSEYARQRDEDQQRQSAEHLGFLAHELRNPLTSARVALATLQRMGMPAHRASEVLSRGLLRLSEQIDHALTSVRLNGRVQLHEERIELATLLADAAAESANDADEKGIAVRIVDEGVGVLNGDVRLLRSMFTNLLRNAIKFTHEGGTVTVRALRLASIVRVEFEDECGGIPDDRLNTVFVPHVQVGGDRSGFGLGLAIAMQAANAHGGTIRVTNLAPRGCAFVVELP
jgi:signal transduction histidine kinase